MLYTLQYPIRASNTRISTSFARPDGPSIIVGYTSIKLNTPCLSRLVRKAQQRQRHPNFNRPSFCILLNSRQPHPIPLADTIIRTGQEIYLHAGSINNKNLRIKIVILTINSDRNPICLITGSVVPRISASKSGTDGLRLLITLYRYI